MSFFSSRCTRLHEIDVALKRKKFYKEEMVETKFSATRRMFHFETVDYMPSAKAGYTGIRVSCKNNRFLLANGIVAEGV